MTTYTPRLEIINGSSCSGSDGDSNRVYTLFEVTSSTFQYGGFDVCTMSGNCNTATSTRGWSGTCPENYKLIVKNGLITDCRRR